MNWSSPNRVEKGLSVCSCVTELTSSMGVTTCLFPWEAGYTLRIGTQSHVVA